MFVALALVAAACGGDDGSSDATTTTSTTQATTTSTTPPTTTTTTAVALVTGLELLTEDGRFDTLVEVIQIAELVELFGQPGTGGTLFAPTDDAFADLPDGLFDSLRTDPQAHELLTELVFSTTLGVQLDSTFVAGEPSITTFNQFTYTVEVDAAGKVVLNGTATIIDPDLRASNGIIHAIDAVLLPPDFLETWRARINS